jgi:4-amino-4-deoxy-L-arabinose transferase-like glycosyltransferase
VHNAWGGAFYGNVARNFVRYGYLETKLASVVNSGVVEPSQFQFYAHHPPLGVWLTSISFHVFGVHEWSARLLPLLFSMLTMALVFHMARVALGRGAALCALAFAAVLPVDAYYATHLDPYGSMAIFFTLLAVEGYRRWQGSQRRRDVAVCAVAIVLGCMTSWYTYFIIPCLVAHHWFVYRRRHEPRCRAPLLLLPALAVGVFVLFMWHRTIALSGGHAELFDGLGTRLAKRTSLELDRLQILKLYAGNVWRLYAFPFVALSAAWLFLFFKDWQLRRLEPLQWCILLLLSYGTLYGIVFPGHLTGHDYFVRAHVPGVALAGAVVVTRIAATLRDPRARSRLTLLLAASACAVAVVTTQGLYARDDRSNGYRLQAFAQAVAERTSLRDPVFLPIRPDAILQFYMDRPTTFDLDTPAKLKSAAASAERPYLFVVPVTAAKEFPEVLAYLRERHAEQEDRGLLLFQAGPAEEAR